MKPKSLCDDQGGVGVDHGGAGGGRVSVTQSPNVQERKKDLGVVFATLLKLEIVLKSKTDRQTR